MPLQTLNQSETTLAFFQPRLLLVHPSALVTAFNNASVTSSGFRSLANRNIWQASISHAQLVKERCWLLFLHHLSIRATKQPTQRVARKAIGRWHSGFQTGSRKRFYHCTKLRPSPRANRRHLRSAPFCKARIRRGYELRAASAHEAWLSLFTLPGPRPNVVRYRLNYAVFYASRRGRDVPKPTNTTDGSG